MSRYLLQLPRRNMPRHRKKRSGWWRALEVAVALAAFSALLVATSVVGALRTPGNSSFSAKWADWLRSHHAAFVANKLEQWYYTAQAPSKGGRPHALNSVPAPITDPASDPLPTVAPPAPSGPSGQALPLGLAPPSPVSLVVIPALPGEGQWQPTGPLVDGQPAMYIAQFRADTVYTSQITSAVWMDPQRLHVRLVPGAQEPGGSWPEEPFLAGAAKANAVAAFNGGFRFQDAKGGFYLDGRQAVPLRTGAASMVIHAGGAVTMGTWNNEVSMTPDVEAVLQNLVPLVDNSALAPAAQGDDNKVWGYTLGANTIVARSGIGVTASGAVLYVAGPALSVRTLAEALLRAGAVRAMTLDLNPAWVTFNLYEHPNPSNPAQVTATKLYPQMERPATRYLGPTRESRDFFTVSLA